MPEQPPVWSSLTPDELEFQYNPQKAFPDFELYRKNREPKNERSLAELRRRADIAYGDHRLRKLDVYPAEGQANAPVHVFLHGGYWRAQDKQNFAFVAGTLVEQGITTAVINYELCPDSTLDEVADSAIAAMRWIFRNIGDYGGDAGNVTLSGHSAGAHLGAEIIAHDWAGEGLADAGLAGATLISGIFDPAPARLTSVNAQLNLTDETIRRRNVEMRRPLLDCPVAIIAGSLEPWQWIDQSFRYFHHLYRHGFRPAVHVLPGRNHFDILDEYLSPATQTVQTILGHVREGGKTGSRAR